MVFTLKCNDLVARHKVKYKKYKVLVVGNFWHFLSEITASQTLRNEFFHTLADIVHFHLITWFRYEMTTTWSYYHNEILILHWRHCYAVKTCLKRNNYGLLSILLYWLISCWMSQDVSSCSMCGGLCVNSTSSPGQYLCQCGDGFVVNPSNTRTCTGKFVNVRKNCKCQGVSIEHKLIDTLKV